MESFNTFQVYLCALTVLIFTRNILESLFLLVTLPVVMRFAHTLLMNDKNYIDSRKDTDVKSKCEKKLPSSVVRKHIGPHVYTFKEAQKQCKRRGDETHVNHIFRTTVKNFVYEKTSPYYKLVRKEEDWEVTEVGLMNAVFDEFHFNSQKSYATLVCKFNIPNC